MFESAADGERNSEIAQSPYRAFPGSVRCLSRQVDRGKGRGRPNTAGCGEALRHVVHVRHKVGVGRPPTRRDGANSSRGSLWQATRVLSEARVGSRPDPVFHCSERERQIEFGKCGPIRHSRPCPLVKNFGAKYSPEYRFLDTRPA